MLFDFYRSKEWENLRAVLTLERVNADDGLLYCDYCKKPIVRAYDAICHHKIQITETNYTDASISLNPDNIQIVHHACHNRLHDKAGFKCKKVYIVYGAPLSGKTTYVHEVMNPGDLVVDLDNIWCCVSGLPRYEKPKRLNTVVFQLRNTLYDMVKYRNGNWNTAYIVGGYPFEAERTRLAGDLNAECILIPSTKEECYSRLQQQSERGEEWKRFIDEWFARYIPPL